MKIYHLCDSQYCSTNRNHCCRDCENACSFRCPEIDNEECPQLTTVFESEETLRR